MTYSYLKNRHIIKLVQRLITEQVFDRTRTVMADGGITHVRRISPIWKRKTTSILNNIKGTHLC